MQRFLCLLIICDFILRYQSNLDRLDLRCQAQCFENFKLSTFILDQKKINENPFLIESFCLNNTRCKGCTTACSTAGSTEDKCQKICKVFQESSSQASCSQSCIFINSMKLNSPGKCPRNISNAKCQNSCQKNIDCIKQGKKCCKTLLCGLTCQIANLLMENLPPIPSAPNVRQTINKKDRDQINFDLDWSTYDIFSINYPVLFLVQVKIDQLFQEKKNVYGVWQDLISTTKSGVIISAIDPENSYQFRLLAFSKNGYKNHGKMTTPITVQYKPNIPMSPINVAEKVSRIIDNHISVTLTWQSGEYTSLVPLSNYNINWKRFHEMYENSNLFPEYDIIIPATETSYTIQNLQPSTTYKIQISSAIVYKGTKYNSTYAIHYLTTTSIPDSPSTKNEPLDSYINDIHTCNCQKSYKESPVIIHNSTMVNGKLSILIKLKDGVLLENTISPSLFHIQWYPTICIKSKQLDSWVFKSNQSIMLNSYINYYITGLRMQCTYKIEVDRLSKKTKKSTKIWDGCFCTPNCETLSKPNVLAKQLCPEEDQHIPPSPENINISLQKSKYEYTYYAKLQWNCISSRHITGFRVTWGPRLEEPIDIVVYSKDFLPLLDYSKATSKVVKYPHQLMILENLIINKIYLVKLQTMNKHLSSEDTVIFFKVHFDKSSSTTSRFHIVLLVLPLLTAFFTLFL